MFLALIAAAASAKPLHIVQIIADDLGYNDLASANGNKTSTPAIDGLLHDGIRLDAYHTFKVCAPSRTSIMTGRYPWKTGYYDMTDDGNHCVDPRFTMLPQLLKGAGYATHAIGKWDVGSINKRCTPTDRGFDSFVGYYETWALLDTVGAQFLWWTWHASEPLYADREGGVPVASSFWIMATMGSMALVLRRLPGGASPGWGLLAGPVASLLLMQLPFLAIFHPLVTFGELHASYAMWALRLGCAAPLLAAVLGAEGSPLGAWARALRSGQPETAVMRKMAAYALGMLLVAASSDPTAERRTSFSQPCARDRDCATDETSFWGAFTRKAHTCTRDNDPARDLYRLCDARCGHAAAPGLETHTVCGVPPEEGWLLLIAAHAVAVLLLVALPFRAPRPKAS